MSKVQSLTERYDELQGVINAARREQEDIKALRDKEIAEEYKLPTKPGVYVRDLPYIEGVYVLEGTDPEDYDAPAWHDGWGNHIDILEIPVDLVRLVRKGKK